MNRGQYYRGQFGKRSERERSLSMLLAPDELAGSGWNIRTERSWRVGMDDQRDPASLRARRSGAFTAIRIFEQEGSSSWVIVKVIPMVSSEDALLVPPESNITLMTGPKSNVVIDTERSIDLDLDLGLGNMKATELTASESPKVANYKFVVGTVDHVRAAICCSGLDEGWSWPEIQTITTVQVGKIRSIASN
jgi:hypothetical protein